MNCVNWLRTCKLRLTTSSSLAEQHNSPPFPLASYLLATYILSPRCCAVLIFYFLWHRCLYPISYVQVLCAYIPNKYRYLEFTIFTVNMSGHIIFRIHLAVFLHGGLLPPSPHHRVELKQFCLHCKPGDNILRKKTKFDFFFIIGASAIVIVIIVMQKYCYLFRLKSAKYCYCGFCLSRILLYFPMCVCPCVRRRDISPFHLYNMY